MVEDGNMAHKEDDAAKKAAEADALKQVLKPPTCSEAGPGGSHMLSHEAVLMLSKASSMASLLPLARSQTDPAHSTQCVTS